MNGFPRLSLRHAPEMTIAESGDACINTVIASAAKQQPATAGTAWIASSLHW
jgi:hypothetical protein